MHLARLGPDDVGANGVLASWIADAWSPYLEWLVGGRTRALQIIEQWLDRDTSELSRTRVTALVDGTRHIGGYIALSGDELVLRRKADLLWLLQHSGEAERRELRTRLGVSRGLFPPVERRDCYLSTIGVVRKDRGRGLGSFLLDSFVQTSFEQGYDALRLNVWADNEAAVRLYRRRGFEAVNHVDFAPIGLRYVAMKLVRSAA